MNRDPKSIGSLLQALRERAKELNCLYAVEEILQTSNAELDSVCRQIINAIPPGWQYPDKCRARIIILDDTYQHPDFAETPWAQHADVVSQGRSIGSVSVFYTEELPTEDDGPFLREETRLIKTIAERLGHFVTYHQMKSVVLGMQSSRNELEDTEKSDWQVVLDLLRQTDRDLYFRISHRMLNHLCWSGIAEAQKLFDESQPSALSSADVDPNRPRHAPKFSISSEMCDRTFEIASESLASDEILMHIQRWIQEDKLSFLVQVVNRHLTLPVVADALRRYQLIGLATPDIGSPARRGVEVALIRRFLSDQLQYINIAKQYVDLPDFYELIQNLIYCSDSHGRLGGKSAGLLLAAKILHKSREVEDFASKIKVPKTWYVTSDILLYFMHYNDLDDVVEQKYKPIDQVRQEYPHIVRMFKSARFPPDIVKSLSSALDDLGDRPLIVRSSSLLEDRMGAAFSGKYKSLFLANQGSKVQRLEALMDAIAEVYASTFGPDPIEYRAERGLIDFGEEMGIMLQEVVGTRVGHYFLPAFAGVAFSRNEFRWSPRIKREDGLLRIVPGLGTRAVDRLSDDYPVLIAPGQPGLRVNATVDEIVRYAPRYIDVINCETNSFESKRIDELIREYGDELPAIHQIVSVMEENDVLKPPGFDTNLRECRCVTTFKGLVSDSPFVKQIQSTLKLLEEKLQTPVDIEFVSDGKDFYLLQCRPQSYSVMDAPAAIPQDTPPDRILFSANRFVSSGRVENISHIVFVDPTAYAELPDRQDLFNVGRAVSQLNKMLPKHQFILIGPGRWGSRGDIKLGVPVTYSDINNTAMLIEVALKEGGYAPDLSFGTHFFQDLVEARIRYLPLYPDDKESVFNDKFLHHAPNLLDQALPEFTDLSGTIRLIDVPKSTGGQLLHVLMNADLDRAVGLLANPTEVSKTSDTVPTSSRAELSSDQYWKWRLQMAERIALLLDPEPFGVAALYIIGSTKNATAGPGSDIDLLIHFRGNKSQRHDLEMWLNGWSICLDEMNFMRTGYRSGGLLDVHIVTDDDIQNKTSYAVKIGAATDAARPLQMKAPVETANAARE